MEGKFTSTEITSSLYIFGDLRVDKIDDNYILTIIYKGVYRQGETHVVNVIIEKDKMVGEGVKLVCLTQTENTCSGHFNIFGQTGDFVLNIRKEDLPIVEKNINDKRQHYYCNIV